MDLLEHLTHFLHNAMNESIINRDKITLTYKAYVTAKYRTLVLLVREMERTIGKETTHEIVEKTFKIR